MSAIDELRLLDGYIEGDKFIMRGILGHAVYSAHNAENLRMMAFSINEQGSNFTIDIDDQKAIHINKEQSKQLRKEYLLLVDDLEGAL